MLGLQQFSDENIAIIHEGAELGDILTQGFDRPRPIHDVGMRRIGQQLFDIISAESAVPFAQHDKFGVEIFHALFEAAIDAAAIAGRQFIEGNRAGGLRALERLIAAVVADDDDPFDQRMGEEILDRTGDAVLVIIGSQRDGDD